MVLLEVVQVCDLVAAQVHRHVAVLHQARHLVGLVLERLLPLYHLLALLQRLRRPLAEPADLLLEAPHVVGHVCLFEELVLEGGEVGGVCVISGLEELQDGEDEVPV